MEKKFIVLSRYEVNVKNGKEFTNWFVTETKPLSELEANNKIKEYKENELLLFNDSADRFFVDTVSWMSSAATLPSLSICFTFFSIYSVILSLHLEFSIISL